MNATEGQAIAWPFLFPDPDNRVQRGRLLLSDNSKRSRDQAETSFSKTQTQFLTRNRIISEHDAVSDARDAKTARLRELRLEKEAEEKAAAAAAPSTKRTGKR